MGIFQIWYTITYFARGIGMIRLRIAIIVEPLLMRIEPPGSTRHGLSYLISSKNKIYETQSNILSMYSDLLKIIGLCKFIWLFLILCLYRFNYMLFIAFI